MTTWAGSNGPRAAWSKPNPCSVPEGVDPAPGCAGQLRPSTVLSFTPPANLLIIMNRPAEAVPLYQQALAVSREINGKKHPDTLEIAKSLEAARHASKNVGDGGNK